LYTRKNLTFCIASLPTSRQQVVFALLVPSCQHVWNKLLTTCNNLADIIRLVARLFQQVRYSHDITILLQPCVVNLVTMVHVTFLFIMTVSYLLEQPCNKSDNAIKLVTSCSQLVPNSLQQLGTSSANTTCRQLVGRLVIGKMRDSNDI
jgi:hypothetical protein